MAVLVAASALMRPGCPCDGPLASADQLLGLLHSLRRVGLRSCCGERAMS